MSIDLDIPEFLRAEVSAKAVLSVEQEAKVKQWLAQGRAPRRTKKQRFGLPRNLEPAAIALLKTIEKEKAEKQALKFKMLRERSKHNAHSR